MVGRLVEHQHVRLRRPPACAKTSRAASPPERLPTALLRRRRRRRAPRRAGRARSRSARPGTSSQSQASTVCSRLARLLAVVLGEVAGVGLVAPLDLAGVGLDHAHRDLEQRRLADAVRADDREPVAALDAERDVRRAPGSSPYAFEISSSSSTCLPDGRRCSELEGRIAARDLRQLLDHDLLDQLELALRLARLGGLGAEAVDELLVVARSRFSRFSISASLRSRSATLAATNVGVVAGVEQDRLVVDVERCGSTTLSRKRWSCEITSAQPV